MLLICVISYIVSINNVQEKNYVGESFVNITHSPCSVQEGNPIWYCCM